ncbi:hypothetical protein AHAS_Ahas11G0187100 [Arachis hypogaea]
MRCSGRRTLVSDTRRSVTHCVKLCRRAFRRRRALVPSQEPPLEEEAVAVRKPIYGEREFTKVGTIVLCSATVSATVYVGLAITATGATRKPYCCCSVILFFPNFYGF